MTALIGFAPIVTETGAIGGSPVKSPSPPLAVSRKVISLTVVWFSSRLKPATIVVGGAVSAAFGIGDNDVTVIGACGGTTVSSMAPSVIHCRMPSIFCTR
jgi:hypothetical protein